MMKKILVMGLLCQSVALAETVIPDVIKVPEGNTHLITLQATGEQIYQCAFKDNVYKWIVSPKAVLMDAQGQVVGHHSKGPMWHFKDGSEVMGKISQKTEGARSVTMPWLLIEAVSHKGIGLFSTVSFIQRINTQGGLEPTLPCDSNHIGTEKPLSYTADYVFYTK